MRKVAHAALLVVALAAGVAPGSARAAESVGLAPLAAAEPLDGAPPQWRRALREIAAEAPVLEACGQAPAACPDAEVRGWLRFLGTVATRPPGEQVRAVHRFVNRLAYRSDLASHGRSDVWSAPLAFFARASGDCEDFAIAKYASLRRLGFPPGRLRLVVLEDVARGVAHAVLAVALEGEVWILDNLADEVLPQSALPHYRPYYALNEEGHWAFALPGTAAAGLSVAAARWIP